VRRWAEIALGPTNVDFVKKKMAGERVRWPKEEYDTKRGRFEDRTGFGREDDEANCLATIRGEHSHHDRARRFSTLTDFLE